MATVSSPAEIPHTEVEHNEIESEIQPSSDVESTPERASDITEDLQDIPLEREDLNPVQEESEEPEPEEPGGEEELEKQITRDPSNSEARATEIVHGSPENPAIKILNIDPADNDIKEFPSLPTTPVDPWQSRRRRHTNKRTNSMALSISSLTTAGQQTVSSSLFIKTALQQLLGHKASSKTPSLLTPATKALGKYFFNTCVTASD